MKTVQELLKGHEELEKGGLLPPRVPVSHVGLRQKNHALDGASFLSRKGE